jgi:hypothetical protein
VNSQASWLGIAVRRVVRRCPYYECPALGGWCVDERWSTAHGTSALHLHTDTRDAARALRDEREAKHVIGEE